MRLKLIAPMIDRMLGNKLRRTGGKSCGMLLSHYDYSPLKPVLLGLPQGLISFFIQQRWVVPRYLAYDISICGVHFYISKCHHLDSAVFLEDDSLWDRWRISNPFTKAFWKGIGVIGLCNSALLVLGFIIFILIM